MIRQHTFSKFNKTKTNNIKTSFANRGMGLENDINLANEYYRINDIAYIYKKPTPIKLVNVDYKAGKIKNSTIEQIKVLTAKIKEEGRKIGKNLEQKQEEKAEAREARAQQRAEAKRKHKEDLIASIERRIQATEKQIEDLRARSGKNMTPALTGGNGNIVPFERD